MTNRMHADRMRVRLAVLAFSAVAGCAQEAPPAAVPAAPAGPAVLSYSGKPIPVAPQCSLDDIQWAGLSCTEDDPCPMYLELSVVTAFGTRILLGGNIHSASVTMHSILLASEDGGQTWREAHARIRGAGVDRIQLFDAENGWASGETLSPLPQDPFILATSDGGRTWRFRPIFTEGRESRYGSVQQFYFSAKDSGSLIVDRGQGSDGDRYELYESQDGGDSWNIRQTSPKPLQLKGVPAPSTEWRLRADRATQSVHIEHRQGERWSSVAAFAVRLGPCKPQQPVEDNPPAAPVKK